MAGKPQRVNPKRSIQVRLDADIRALLTHALCGSSLGSQSFSRLFESIILLAEQIYMHEGRQGFYSRCCRLAALRLEKAALSGVAPRQTTVHVTIDPRACDFVDMLCRTYRGLFSSRSDVACVLTFQAAQRCADEKQAHYLSRRLEYVASMWR